MIYGWLSVPEVPDRFVSGIQPSHGNYGGGPIQLTHNCSNIGPPPFLRVCRQIRHEGLLIYYKQSSFYLRVRQDTPISSAEGDQPIFPSPQAGLLPSGSGFVVPFSNSILLDTFSPGSDVRAIQHLTVVWQHDNLSDFTRLAYPLQLLNMGFIGIGEKKRADVTRNPARRIGDDILDWTDQKAVLRAYISALPVSVICSDTGALVPLVPDVSRGSGRSINWHARLCLRQLFSMAGIQDLVRAMRLFKVRCPEAMTWVEAKVEVPAVIPQNRNWSVVDPLGIVHRMGL